MAIVLSGKDVALSIKKELAEQCRGLAKQQLLPQLHIIRVGERTDDISYQKSLEKLCAETGITCSARVLPKNSGQKTLEQAISDAATDQAIHGMLLFSPLPHGYNLKAAANLIPTHKDIDCLNPISSGKIFTQEEAYPPATAAAVIRMLDFYQADLEGKDITIVGRSLVVGKPLAMLLLDRNATITIAHSHSDGLPSVCRRADIIIAATGRAKMFTGNFFTPGQVVIDVGINDDPDHPGQLCGDVDYETAEQIVAAITPVPGGIGSITSAILCSHVAEACAKSANKG